MQKKDDPSDREIVISRVFNAPRELAWQAMTDPRHVVKWWGPRGFTSTIREMDLRPGGIWSHVMHGPDGTDYPNESRFTEVVKYERIVYQHGGGRPGSAIVDFEATWTFEDTGNNTCRVTQRMLFPSAEARDRVAREYGAIEGAKDTFERLSGHLAETARLTQQFTATRVLDAPRDLVFRMWTEPGHLAQWWGPTGFTNPVCEVDARPGGAIRIHMRAPDGNVYPMGGVFREVVPPERIVFLSYALDEAERPLFEVLNTVVLEEVGGKTVQTLTARVVKTSGDPSRFLRHLEGMQQGWTQSLERLAAHVSSVR
jgi:uncharacterized protein YndB with AHSA1/START domain